ncbi:hypothetical protein BH10PLA2_BH10PLA2_24440 [soil metagenome]
MPIRFLRRRRSLILFGICCVFLLPCIAVGVAWFLGDTKLTAALAETDRLDPGWRNADAGPESFAPTLMIDASFQDSYSVANHLSELGWPNWPFPKFDSEPEYLARVRRAMTAGLLPERADYGFLNDGNYTTAKNAGRLNRLLNDEQVRVLRSQVKLVQPQLEKARKQAELPTELLDGSGGNPAGRSVMHLGDMMRTIDALKYEGLLKAHDGDLAGALHNVRAMLSIVCWPASLRPQDRSQAFQSLTDDTVIALERTLSMGTANENELCQLQILLSHHEKTSPLFFWLRGLRAQSDKQFEAVQKGEVSFVDFRKEEIVKWRARPAFFAECLVLQSYISIRNLRALNLRYLNEAIEIAKLPADKQEVASREFCARPVVNRQCQGLLSPPSLPAFLHHFIMIRCAIAVVAAERFRLAQGRWPNSWDEMIPKFLPAVPRDPFDGSPLGLAVHSELFVAFAPGEVAYRRANALETSDDFHPEDYGFRIFNPDRRRQPAQPFVFPPRGPAKARSTNAAPDADVK